MNIKSLLLGSAAALVAVSGARAADAVVMAEPEAVEYVRVCDVYGAGFFYIPGTETCLQISGFARYNIDVYTNDGGPPVQIGTVPLGPIVDGQPLPGSPIFAADRDSFYKNAEARLNIDARSETEWGTLQGYLRFVGNSSQFGLNPGTVSSDPAAFVDQVFIRFGGAFKVTMGYTESYWVDSKDGVGAYGTFTTRGLNYAYQQRNLVAFNFDNGSGFKASLALEDDGVDGNYVPDVVGKLGYAATWGSVYAAVGYDESASEFAVRVGGSANVPVGLGGSLRVYGFYASAPNAYWSASKWSVVAAYNQKLTDTLSGTVGVQYFGDTNFAVAGSPDTWSVEAGLAWTPVTNLLIQAEVYYNTTTEVVNPRLRFTRSF
jgi:hypothetical protein